MIRPALPTDAEAIARVHVDSWRTTYRGVVDDAFLDSLSYDNRTNFWSTVLAKPLANQRAFVAENADGKVIGFASGGPERSGDDEHSGEIYAIYLLREAQGTGTGRALIRTLAEALHEEGHESVLVWVLADNPSRGFYEKLGGTYLREKEVVIGEQRLKEIAYGWREMMREMMREIDGIRE